MDTLQALILGLVQGLTEYLPVSSSGHLAIGSALCGMEGEESLAFTIAVHVATVLSTLVVLRKESMALVRGILRGEKEELRYGACIVVSMVPIGVVGLCFKDKVEELFGAGLTVVGCCLLLTAALLAFSYYSRPRMKERIGLWDAFVIGLAQALAVLPGLSRSGSTIATGLLLGNRKESMARFSFFMVIPPVLGEALLDGLKMMKGGSEVAGGIPPVALLTGFVAAFVAGCLACRWMIALVSRGKLIGFAWYCAAAGLAALAYGIWG